MAPQTAAGPGPRELKTVDLPNVAHAARGRKPAWSQQCGDLNVNLISCTAGQGVSDHVNTEVDVLLVGIDGEGSVAIEGHRHTVRPDQAIIIPKGTRRAIHCDGDHFACLTCHRRRLGLLPVISQPDGAGRAE